MAKQEKIDVTTWLDAGEYLPGCLRDFHDQKDVFKSIGNTGIGPAAVSWVAGHIYVIDHFLHFMARHGYTLQRSRARVGFDYLGATVKARRDKEAQGLRAFLDGNREPGKSDS